MSILGPILFNLYMLPPLSVINIHKIGFCQYADDTELYLSLAPNAHGSIPCTDDINSQMSQTFLQLNKEKTDACYWD